MDNKIESVKYLKPADFDKKYPRGSILGSGSYGTVYKSNDYVVKKFTAGHDYSFFKEIDAYSHFDHPCIFKVSDFTYYDDGGAYALPLGSDLLDAYAKGSITLRQITSDLVSAVALMNSINIVHGDIKPDNLVYHQGRAVLIDFGLIQYCADYKGLGPVFTDIAFTTGYRDPTFAINEYNSIKLDIYAIGKTIYAIYKKSRFAHCGDFKSTGDALLDDFLRECVKPVSERMTIQELSKHKYIERTYNSSILLTPVVKVEECQSGILAKLTEWLCEVALRFKHSSRTLFLGLHLIHRTLPVILPQYSTNNEQKKKVQLVGMACMLLADFLLDNNISSYDDYVYVCADAYSMNQIRATIVDILNITHGVIFTLTYWDYAMSLDDLAMWLPYVMSCNYLPSVTPPLTETKLENKGKNVFSDVLVQAARNRNGNLQDKAKTIKYTDEVKAQLRAGYFNPNNYAFEMFLDNVNRWIARSEIEDGGLLYHYSQYISRLDNDRLIKLSELIADNPCLNELKLYKPLEVKAQEGKDLAQIDQLKPVEVDIMSRLAHPNILHADKLINVRDKLTVEGKEIPFSKLMIERQEVSTSLAFEDELPENFEDRVKLAWSLICALYFLDTQGYTYIVLDRTNVFLKGNQLYLGYLGKVKKLDGQSIAVTIGDDVDVKRDYLDNIPAGSMLAPEVITTKKYNSDSAIFNMGRLLLVILNGKNIDDLRTINSYSGAKEHYETFDKAVARLDSKLSKTGFGNSRNNVIKLLAGCLQYDPKKRIAWYGILNAHLFQNLKFIEGHVLPSYTPQVKPQYNYMSYVARYGLTLSDFDVKQLFLATDIAYRTECKDLDKHIKACVYLARNFYYNDYGLSVDIVYAIDLILQLKGCLYRSYLYDAARSLQDIKYTINNIRKDEWLRVDVAKWIKSIPYKDGEKNVLVSSLVQ